MFWKDQCQSTGAPDTEVGLHSLVFKDYFCPGNTYNH